LTWFNGVCGGGGKRGALVGKKQGHVAKKGHCDDFFFKFWGGEDEDKRTQKEWSNLIFFPYFFKIQHIHYLVVGHSSWSTFGLHLTRGPKAL
jgi:hypothetical protein